MNTEENNTKLYYIAYFDILGYKSFFEDSENDVNELLKKCIAIANDTKTLKRDFGLTLTRDIFYKLFSDNCVIMMEKGTCSQIDEVLHWIRLIASLQLQFLSEYGIPIRGGITMGQAYIDDDIVLGKGLIEAVRLESEVARYPRIVIDKFFINQNSINDQELIKKDNDGEYYLDFFSLLTVRDVFYPEVDKKRKICNLRDQVFKLIKKYCRYDKRMTDNKKIEQRERIIDKYLWLLMKYNRYVEGKGIPTKITYNITINEHFSRFEIKNVQKNLWPVVGN